MTRLARLPSRSQLAIAGLTLAMHGLLVAVWQHLPHAQSATGAPGSAVQVRLVQSMPPAMDTASQLDEPGQSRASSLAPQATATSTETAKSPPALPSGRASSNPALSSPPQAPLQRASNEWAYLPASQLDQRPVLESAVTLPFPEGENLPRGASVSAVLVLYVSADGTVDRIEFAQSALPEAFARTAVESFSHLRLRPGMKDGRARRAMIKIEVEFEAQVGAKQAVLESSRSWQATE